VIKTYVYKIKADNSFDDKFKQWVGTCRFLYNCALEMKIDAYKRCGINLSNYTIQKHLTEAKKEFLFLREVGSQTLLATLDKLDNAYKSFFRRGYGFPKFVSKKKWKPIPFKTIQLKDSVFILPKWGSVKVFKDRLPDGKLKTASLVKKADGYYLHVQAEVSYMNNNESQVGIDMGIKYFLVTSDGLYIQNPQHLKSYEKKLRVENRSLSRKKKFSKNWYKQVQRLQKLHLKIQRVRLDFLHKVSTSLSKRYGTIYMEDLNISGMTRSNLSKHILDCSWANFKTLLSYKSVVISVDPKHTSQSCSNCGFTDKRNRISQSEFICKNCGSIFNADHNASLNILSRGTALMRERKAIAYA
jgi:putative transposase